MFLLIILALTMSGLFYGLFSVVRVIPRNILTFSISWSGSLVGCGGITCTGLTMLWANLLVFFHAFCSSSVRPLRTFFFLFGIWHLAARTSLKNSFQIFYLEAFNKAATFSASLIRSLSAAIWCCYDWITVLYFNNHHTPFYRLPLFQWLFYNNLVPKSYPGHINPNKICLFIYLCMSCLLLTLLIILTLVWYIIVWFWWQSLIWLAQVLDL